MEKRLTMIFATLFLCLGMAMAQSKVSGVVTSAEDDEPVIGASVKVVGTNTGTVTNIDGQFQLQIADGAKLEISYIGMQTKTVKATPKMKIVLDPDNQSLDEVMVVAFGTAKKSAFTGSAAVIDSKELSKKVATNVAESLVGSVAGLQLRGQSGQPGTSAVQGDDPSSGIKIRGIASMYASTNPLVIVDGAPYPDNLSSIPSDDIESVTVLKDAASAALYGARGAAGVIIVTTKSGKNRDAEITVDAKWGANSRAVQDYDVITDPAEYYEAVYAAAYNKSYYGEGLSASAANIAANNTMLKGLAYNIYTLPEGQQLIGMNGKINPAATLGRTYEKDGEKYYLIGDDWNKAAYKTALRQEYNVSAKGSYDRGSFYVSAGYLNDEGIIDNSSYERISARAKADYQAKSWLKLGVNAQYVHSDTKSSPNLDEKEGAANIMYYASRIAPIYPIYIRKVGDDGKPYIATDKYGHQRYDYGLPAGYGMTRPFMATGNPLGSNQYNTNDLGVNQLNGTFIADISFTDWLKLNVTSNINYNTAESSIYANSFEGPGSGDNGRLQKGNTNTMRTNNTQTLTFMKSFGKHNVDALIGHEYYKQQVKYLYSAAKGEFSPYLQEIYAYANKFDGSSYTNNYNVEGFFGRAQYNYDGRYFASLSYRRDASSYFAKDHRWGDFWSAGGAWIISKEKWFNAPFVDELKLKASIGQQGNDNIGAFAYTDLYILTPNASNNGMSPSFGRMGNENITWETTTNFNAGVEFSIFKSRLTGSIDFYTKKTSDMLFWLSIPEGQGTRGYYGNLGDIRNTGIELVLSAAVIRTKDIDWNITANLSHNSTKILKLPASKIQDNGGFREAMEPLRILPMWYREGGPLYNAMMPDYAGVNEKGEALYWVDANIAEGKESQIAAHEHSYTTTDYSKASYYEQGSLLPKVFGGLSTNFRYKSFDVAMTFDYQIGGHVYDHQYAQLMQTPITKGENWGQAIHKDWAKAWSTNNTSSNIPRWQNSDNYATASSSRFLTNAGYFNFQSFSVGYTLPKGLIPEVSKVRVYVMGENLAFWSARKGLDPRFSFLGSGNVGTYSPIRNISGGIQVSF